MARMIPPVIDSGIKSSAERTIYGWLEKLEWKNCVVLHSLGIAQHLNNIFGEIDFVVISREGILCIEVKGGQVYRREGIWYFKNRFGQENSRCTGPFEQVQGNMQSLRAHMIERLGSSDSLVRCQYACCVMTPDCTVDNDAVDVLPEILFDCKYQIDDLNNFFDDSMNYWRTQCILKHGFEGGALSDYDINRAVNILRGDFKFVPSLSVILNRVDEQMISLTDEQYLIMQGFDYSERLLISGAAGTGKTLLSLEQCRRLSAEGRKVLYLCYNRRLGMYVSELRDKEKGDYDVYNLHKLMMDMCDEFSEADYSTAFFESELPIVFCDHYKNEDFKEKYDAVIIDEGQDLMNTCYYACVDSLIDGGFSNGVWSVYFDPNQNIFNDNREFEHVWKHLKMCADSSYTLTRNCRNTRQIVVANKMISNILQAKQLRAEGNEVEYIKYYSKEDEFHKLVKLVRNLRSQGILANEIVILSESEQDSCLKILDVPGDIGPIRINPNVNISHSSTTDFFTIQSYKGLESKVIILTDIENFCEPRERLLHYTAISRARTLLYILYNENIEEQRQQMLLNGALMEVNDTTKI
jgi:hypothetical protein